jgi:hypothetical protein
MNDCAGGNVDKGIPKYEILYGRYLCGNEREIGKQ